MHTTHSPNLFPFIISFASPFLFIVLSVYFKKRFLLVIATNSQGNLLFQFMLDIYRQLLQYTDVPTNIHSHQNLPNRGFFSHMLTLKVRTRASWVCMCRTMYGCPKSQERNVSFFPVDQCTINQQQTPSVPTQDYLHILHFNLVIT